ncbi:MAG: PcfJ domain-containing protein, partial [Bacteroidales bacterium]|nr:PcfJ domain-containing protein [Candidatus Colicola equi]
MKARTKLEKEVMALSATLPKITPHQEAVMKEKAFWKFATKLNTINVKYHCQECGAKFYADPIEKKYGGRKYNAVTCPECGEQLHELLVEKGRGHRVDVPGIHCFITTKGRFLVLRYFTCEKISSTTQRPYYSPIFECCQNWIPINPKKGEGVTIVARNRNTGLFYRIQEWNWSSEMSIKKASSPYAYYGGSNPFFQDCEWSVVRVPDMIRKYSAYLKKSSYSAPYNYYRDMLDVKVQTLLQCGYGDVVRWLSNSDIYTYWDSIRICLRNKYHARDWTMWRDMVKMQRDMQRDTRNAHYVCPADLHAAHDAIMREHRRAEEVRRKKAAAEQLRKQMEREKEAVDMFYSFKAKFFDIVLQAHDFHVIVLATPEAHLQEGDAMHHC